MRGGRIVALLLAFCLLAAAGAAIGYARRPSASLPSPDSSAPAEEQAEAAELTILCPKFDTAADSFLFCRDGEAVLLDTGEDTSAAAILAAMKAENVTSLEAMILTHFDKDHIGGAAEILRQVPVKTIYRTGFTSDSDLYFALLDAMNASGAEIITLEDTQTFSAAGADFTLYPPLADHYSNSEDNNSSIIAGVSCGSCSLLFTGDAEKKRLKEFLSRQYDGTQYDFLKVPHHGRDPKPLKKLLKEFTPADALITSSGEEPEDAELVQLLEDADAAVWLTREGSVTLRCDGKSIQVTQSREN